MNRGDRRRGPVGRVEADRRRLILYVTLGVIAIAILIAVAVAARVPKAVSSTSAPAHLQVGDSAPAFAAGQISGPARDGQPTLLEVFATWCPHCQRETSILNELYDKYGSRVHFAAISGSPYGMDENSPETPEDVIAFSQRFKTRYPLVYDGSLDVANHYMQAGFPTVVVIDRAGKVAWIRDGEISRADIAKALDATLK